MSPAAVSWSHDAADAGDPTEWFVSSDVWLRGLGCDADDAGDAGSVKSLLLLHEDASEHVNDATPLFTHK